MSTVTNFPISPALTREDRATSADAAQREQVATAAREFEAMFLLQMLKQMRQSMLDGDETEPGLGAATMTDTIDAELARHLSGQPGGLYDVLLEAFADAAGVEGTPSAAGSAYAATPAAPAIVPVTAVRTPAVGPPAIEPARRDATGPDLQLPEGRVSSKYGWRSDPFTGAARFHKGVDIAAAYGEPVAAAGAGRVVFAGTQGGYGQTVIIEHDGGLRTRYAHLSQVDVAVGDEVRQGAGVGRVGRSGRATGAHLHFELLEDGRPVNPARAAELGNGSDGLKVARAGADYPTGMARTAVPTGVTHEN